MISDPHDADHPAADAPPRSWDRLGFPAVLTLLTLLVWTVLRAVLYSAFGPAQGESEGQVCRMFLTGFHFDVAIAALVWLPLAVWTHCARGAWLSRRWFRWLTWGASWFWSVLVIFLAFSEYYFFKEYLSRFNTVAIDYIHYWTEVSANIREMYPVPDIAGACVLGAAALVFVAWNVAPLAAGLRAGRRALSGLAWAVAATLLCATLSSAELRFTSERTASEIASNGLFSGFMALVTRDLDYKVFYSTTERDLAFARSRALTCAPGEELSPAPDSLQRHVPGDPSRPKLNVIVMLEESFGSEFWGVLTGKEGKKSMTPAMDRVANEDGMLFDNLYADGNRTIRGVEGVIASFPPLPGDSILARTRTHNVETLAQVLRRDGYSTTFVYPGRGFFDGLRPFALDNGYDRFIEQKDFEHPAFATTWGVCNEDLYDRAIAEMRVLHKEGKPFFITTLSVSNHQPFTYPEGRIAEPSNQHSRKNAVKYVDYALGRFFDAVKKEEFWKDTIFVVVADHGARVYGSQTIPMHSYEIPLLVAGPAAVKAPARVSTLGCQLDIAPTILGLIGRPYDTMFYGHDLCRTAPDRTRVLLHHNRSIGIYHDDHLVTFSLNKEIDYFHGDPKNEKLEHVSAPDEIDRKLAEEAAALFQTADELYTQQRYRVQTPAKLPESLPASAVTAAGPPRRGPL